MLNCFRNQRNSRWKNFWIISQCANRIVFPKKNFLSIKIFNRKNFKKGKYDIFFAVREHHTTIERLKCTSLNNKNIFGSMQTHRIENMYQSDVRVLISPIQIHTSRAPRLAYNNIMYAYLDICYLDGCC